MLVPTPLFKGLTRPVLKGGLPFPIFLIVNLSLPIVVMQSGSFIFSAGLWAASYTAMAIATLYNPHFAQEFFVGRVLARPNGSVSALGVDSLGGH